MAISSPGIGSSLDVNGIIEQLMQAESKPLTALSKKESSYQSKLSAYGTLSSALSTFQNSVTALSGSSKFQQVSATSADPAIVSAGTTGSAAAGKYDIQVIQRAQAQSITAAGQASTTALIGSGASKLTFQFGTIEGGTLADGKYAGAAFKQDANQATATVSIADGENSLKGIRDAINKAGIGVTATIVSDGGDEPNRLVLTNTRTGAASSMKISVDGDPALTNLLGYDPEGTQALTQNTAGQDALAKVNGIDIKNASNTLTGTVEGLVLTLAKVGTTSVTVARDTASIETRVNAFVKAYNELHGTLKYQTGYNATTKTGGPLLGDAAARTIQTELRRAFSTQPEGLNGGLVNLSQVGISFQKDGSLALDSGKFQAAMSKNADNIAALFGTVGKTTDSLVAFNGSTSATKAGNYEVNITSLATQGSLTGGSDVDLNSAPTGIAANTKVTMTLDGVTASVALPEGDYTSDKLAVMLQSAINGTAAFSDAGSSVRVAITAGGQLSILSNRYGSASAVAMASETGTTISDFLGTPPPAIAGKDVVGTIGGQAATGSGNFLTGAPATPVEGLKLEITGGLPGSRGTVNFSQGYADRLNTVIGSFLGSSGLISGRTDGLNRSIKDVGKSREAVNQRLVETEKRYRAQFTALDAVLSGMSSTSTFLAQQLANLPKSS
ncbi:MAG: fliD [Noviherbaspirillum sp.]|nr:fliD [Noviherbaspirillum sp.]MDB5793801.1 fliD [Noviherbaspirillum sp.]